MSTPETDITPKPGDPAWTRLQRALGDSYRLTRELSGGGMARVFVARDVSLARDVVVKVLPDELAGGLAVERFRREILLAATLSHPNIVGVIGAGEADGHPYFVMPFVEGESLRARLIREGKLPVAQAVSMLRDVARALEFAHGRGVVHRDIKPDNVLLVGGAALVADFGVAKAVASVRQEQHVRGATITGAGSSLGTPAYMAPEQVAGDPAIDHRADLYAFGILAYELLAGHTPFAGRGVTEQLTAHLVEAPTPIAEARAEVPAALAQLIMQCLAKAPGARPASAHDVLRALDDPAVVSGSVVSGAILTGTGLSLPVPAVLRRKRVRAWGIAALLLATVGAGGFALASAVRDRAAPATTVATTSGIAVFPFVNASPDSADAYLALSMTDELTVALGRLPGVRVASRSVAQRARDASDPGTAARDLSLTYFVEGTVQRIEGRIRIAVRLVNARDGFSAWSDVYEEPTRDLLAVQADIAAQIAAAVGAGISEVKE